MAKCENCYDMYPCEWEEKELFSITTRKGKTLKVCGECQQQLEVDNIESGYMDSLNEEY